MGRKLTEENKEKNGLRKERDQILPSGNTRRVLRTRFQSAMKSSQCMSVVCNLENKCSLLILFHFSGISGPHLWHFSLPFSVFIKFILCCRVIFLQLSRPKSLTPK